MLLARCNIDRSLGVHVPRRRVVEDYDGTLERFEEYLVV